MSQPLQITSPLPLFSDDQYLLCPFLVLASYQSALSAQEPFKIYFTPFFFARFGYLCRSFLLHHQHLSSSHLTPIPLAVGDTVFLPFTATIHNFFSDVVNTSTALFKHWYHHRQRELQFYTEELARPGAHCYIEMLHWSILKQQFRTTGLRIAPHWKHSDSGIPEQLISTSKAVVKSELHLKEASIPQDL